MRFKIKIGNSISKREILLFNKTYEERTENFQQMLYNKSVKAINTPDAVIVLVMLFAESRNIL